MTNFGERVAYWYLRLQGFLPVQDFVLHGDGSIDRTADADLVAVRLTHSKEEINGESLKPDSALEKQLAATGRNVALIVQVKTGGETGAGRAFESGRLEYAIRFLGFAPPGQVGELARGLADKPSVEFAFDWKIAKLFVADNPQCADALNVSLQDALGFIRDRLASYRDTKSRDRIFFPDELMQFLAWSAGKAA